MSEDVAQRLSAFPAGRRPWVSQTKQTNKNRSISKVGLFSGRLVFQDDANERKKSLTFLESNSAIPLKLNKHSPETSKNGHNRVKSKPVLCLQASEFEMQCNYFTGKQQTQSFK